MTGWGSVEIKICFIWPNIGHFTYVCTLYSMVVKMPFLKENIITWQFKAWTAKECNSTKNENHPIDPQWLFPSPGRTDSCDFRLVLSERVTNVVLVKTVYTSTEQIFYCAYISTAVSFHCVICNHNSSKYSCSKQKIRKAPFLEPIMSVVTK